VSEAFAVLFLLLVAVCALLAVASLLTPKAAALLRQKTKGRGFLAWLGLGVIFFVAMLICAPKDGGSFKMPPKVESAASAPAPAPKAEAPAPVQKAEAPTPAPKAEMPKPEAVKQETPKPAPSAREKTRTVQKELAALYRELKSMRGTPQFIQMGFGAGNPQANQWKKNVEDLRARAKDPDINPTVGYGPGYLLMLGLAWQREYRKSDRKYADDCEKTVRAALNWKAK